MGKKSDRHVVPSRDGGWDIVAPGVQRASSHHGTQQAAIERAREIVQNEGGGEAGTNGSPAAVTD